MAEEKNNKRDDILNKAKERSTQGETSTSLALYTKDVKNFINVRKELSEVDTETIDSEKEIISLKKEIVSVSPQYTKSLVEVKNGFSMINKELVKFEDLVSDADYSIIDNVQEEVNKDMCCNVELDIERNTILSNIQKLFEEQYNFEKMESAKEDDQGSEEKKELSKIRKILLQTDDVLKSGFKTLGSKLLNVASSKAGGFIEGLFGPLSGFVKGALGFITNPVVLLTGALFSLLVGVNELTVQIRDKLIPNIGKKITSEIDEARKAAAERLGVDPEDVSTARVIFDEMTFGKFGRRMVEDFKESFKIGTPKGETQEEQSLRRLNKFLVEKGQEPIENVKVLKAIEKRFLINEQKKLEEEKLRQKRGFLSTLVGPTVSDALQSDPTITTPEMLEFMRGGRSHQNEIGSFIINDLSPTVLEIIREHLGGPENDKVIEPVKSKEELTMISDISSINSHALESLKVQKDLLKANQEINKMMSEILRNKQSNTGIASPSLN